MFQDLMTLKVSADMIFKLIRVGILHQMENNNCTDDGRCREAVRELTKADRRELAEHMAATIHCIKNEEHFPQDNYTLETLQPNGLKLLWNIEREGIEVYMDDTHNKHQATSVLVSAIMSYMVACESATNETGGKAIIGSEVLFAAAIVQKIDPGNLHVVSVMDARVEVMVASIMRTLYG
jgi:hypothetical protein